MDAKSFLAAELCEADIVATTKKGLLEYSAERLATHPATKGISRDTLLHELQKRERQTSTGFGDQVAIPHARIEGMSEFVVFVLTSKEGIPFRATDGLPVKLFLISVGPEERVEDHLKILALLSRTLCKEGVKDLLIAHTDSAALYQQVEREIEQHLAANTIPTTPRAASDSKRKAGAAGSLMLINVYEEDYLQQVLESLLEYGITGATIIDSTGMGQFLSEAPLFGNFIGCMRQNRYHSKTVIAIAEDARAVERLFDEIERNVGEERKYEIVSLLAMPIQTMRGSMSAV